MKQKKNILLQFLEKNKKRKKHKISFILIFPLIILLGIIGVFASDIFYNIPYQVASHNGSNNSFVSFSTGGTSGGGVSGTTIYANKGADSSIVGNYFLGYYYDSVLGFFKLDWSSDINQNVRIIDSTSKCSSGHGYKLGGYARSNYYGFMDFDYNNDIFVYYCDFDKSLHGHAYTKYNGFQSFEGIGFEILPSNAPVSVSGTGIFVNDTTKIGIEKSYTGSDSSAGYNSFGGDIFNFDDTKDSLFYIIK